MAKTFLFVVLFIVAVKCDSQPPMYIDPNDSETVPQEGCNEEFETVRNQVIAKSTCGPKEILVHLTPPTRIEEVRPGAIMVKRCEGICTFETNQDDTCVPTKMTKKPIHVRVNNVKTWMSKCMIYQVEEHQSCSCSCKLTPEKCTDSEDKSN